MTVLPLDKLRNYGVRGVRGDAYVGYRPHPSITALLKLLDKIRLNFNTIRFDSFGK